MLARHNLQTYSLILAISILAALAAWLLPVPEWLQGAFGASSVAALVAALFQLARDEARFEKDLELQRVKQKFDLGVASHMANRLFDKHIEFCEAYMSEVENAVTTLVIHGTTSKALDHANNLYNIRRDYSAWITNEIGEQLAPFEGVLRSIGAGQHYVEKTSGLPQYAERQSETINNIEDLFEDIIGLGGDRSEGRISSTEKVKESIRSILGIEELLHLRQNALRIST